MKSTKKLAILNLLSIILVITVNYISQAIRVNQTTIGEMSEKYENLFTPADYAFSIWGVIFLGLLGFAIFQIRRAFSSSESDEFIEQIGYWFVLANTLNCCWIFAFLYDNIGWSVVLMFGILFTLLKIVVNTNMERWNAPFPIIAFVWWPICLYSGWISVATIANISAYLTKIEWQGFWLSSEAWTITILILAALLNIFMVLHRNMREFAAVGVWALIAIFIRHKHSYGAIAITALTMAFLVLMIIAWHAYKNRHTHPIRKKLMKLKNGHNT